MWLFSNTPHLFPFSNHGDVFRGWAWESQVGEGGDLDPRHLCGCSCCLPRCLKVGPLKRWSEELVKSSIWRRNVPVIATVLQFCCSFSDSWLSFQYQYLLGRDPLCYWCSPIIRFLQSQYWTWFAIWNRNYRTLSLREGLTIKLFMNAKNVNWSDIHNGSLSKILFK